MAGEETYRHARLGRNPVEYPILDVDKMVHLSPEQKAEFSRTCRAYQEAINALALLPAAAIDVEAEEPSE
jgi:hypothetical protein